MFDDEKNQVTYVFVSNNNPDTIKTDYPIKPENMKGVVTVFNANTNNKGFSVKSFYDEKGKYYH